MENRKRSFKKKHLLLIGIVVVIAVFIIVNLKARRGKALSVQVEEVTDTRPSSRSDNAHAQIAHLVPPRALYVFDTKPLLAARLISIRQSA